MRDKMEEKKLKIPKKITINTTIGDFVAKKLMKVKMGDITSTHEFDIKVREREITISHPNKKSLNLFAKRLNVLIKDSGNKLDKIIG